MLIVQAAQNRLHVASLPPGKEVPPNAILSAVDAAGQMANVMPPKAGERKG